MATSASAASTDSIHDSQNSHGELRIESNQESQSNKELNVESQLSKKPKEETQLLKCQQCARLKWFLICSALFTSSFIYGLDNTIVAAIQAPIVQKFGEVQK